MSKKAIKQRQKAGARVVQMKKKPKKIDSGLLYQYKYDNDDINKSQYS